MEGAAIGQAAYLNHIPFLVVRAISDKADGSAHMDYAEFEMAAIEHSVKLTVRISRNCNLQEADEIKRHVNCISAQSAELCIY